MTVSAETSTEMPTAPAQARRDLVRGVAIPFLASRLVIWWALVFALLSLPLSQRAGPAENVPRYSQDLGWLTDVWARWDSVDIVAIAVHGYDGPFAKSSVAFYPLYPALVGGLGRILLGHYVLAGVIVSLVACVAAATMLYELARRRLGDQTALRAVIFFGLFPYAFFLQAVYTESLFLALGTGAFLAAERRRMWVAGTLCGLALLTRPTGAAVVLGVLVLAWQGRSRIHDAVRILVPAVLLFALFPLALWIETGKPLEFVHGESLWGRRLSPLGPADGIWYGVRAAWFGARQLISGSPEHPFWVAVEPDRYAVMNLEILFYVVVFTALSVIAWRKVGAAYGAYALGCIALALSAPSHHNPSPLLSAPRFMLVVFPAFIALGAVARRPWLVWGIAGTEAVFLGVNLVRWAAWQFVA